MSWFLIDRLGRRPMQVWGFLASAVILVIFAFMRTTAGIAPLLAYIVYGLFNITQQGPAWCQRWHLWGGTVADPHPQRRPEHHRRRWPHRRNHQRLRVSDDVRGVASFGSMLVLAGVAVIGAILSHLLVPETSFTARWKDINSEVFVAAPSL